MQTRALSGRPSAARASCRPFSASRNGPAPRAGVLAAAGPSAAPLPEALLFDCDGVIVDTEKDGHRVSFNEAFKRKGLDHDWGVELYGELLEIGGGKERMTKYFKDVADREPFRTTTDPAAQQELVKGLHLLKTDLFMDLVEAGSMPLRPGVARLVKEAVAAGVPVAVCSTSNERAVSTIVRVMLGEDVAKVMRVFAGDVVPKKKPDPAIYLLAAKELGVSPARCVVVEDSRIGLRAAKSAGMTCIVTKSSYTQNEDFTGADAVFDSLDAGEVTLAKLSELAAAATAANAAA
ncbi:Protein cbbY, chromosomal [Monoraphidium neglectum]|uniref:Protein cbbY, chromosomal n=1 Tax=Monoraphidium neglectum TaxID=145388 RepID=A0A0D2N562_9CHLO|nr:Protein cbbY, chromosomal [Monoraphidium neglectum]KIZ07442.1 Protein cbbY, chromosomal [Monoraphidium neglectum]|eukprot:XP_013906461.1 Protein cbbY, chromosomal [Monoraphidium neglectum]